MATQVSTVPDERRGIGLPVALLVPAFVGLAFLVLPLVGLLVRAPWRTLPSQLFSAEVGTALRLSLVSASLATVVCLVLGVPLAWVLARATFPGRRLLRSLVTVPLVLPPVVGGVALLLLLGRRGLLGQYLFDWFGVSLPFTTAAVVLAEAFVAMPFLVIAVEGALRGADRRYEDAAATLGASRWTIFRRVTLPLVAPGVTAGAVLCFARALGEFGATITFAGQLPGGDPHDADRGVPGPGDQPRGGDRALAGAARCLGPGADQPARPLGERDDDVSTLAVDRVAGGLDARLVVRRPRFDLDLDLQVETGSVVALLGPNGAGKSTALRALAGLVPLSDGHVRLGGRVLDADGRATPTDLRGVGMVFQDYLLFPHLSAVDNVAFGLRCRGHVSAHVARRGDGAGSRESVSRASNA